MDYAPNQGGQLTTREAALLTPVLIPALVTWRPVRTRLAGGRREHFLPHRHERFHRHRASQDSVCSPTARLFGEGPGVAP